MRHDGCEAANWRVIGLLADGRAGGLEVAYCRPMTASAHHSSSDSSVASRAFAEVRSTLAPTPPRRVRRPPAIMLLVSTWTNKQAPLPQAQLARIGSPYVRLATNAWFTEAHLVSRKAAHHLCLHIFMPRCLTDATRTADASPYAQPAAKGEQHGQRNVSGTRVVRNSLNQLAYYDPEALAIGLEQSSMNACQLPDAGNAYRQRRINTASRHVTGL